MLLKIRSELEVIRRFRRVRYCGGVNVVRVTVVVSGRVCVRARGGA